MNFEIPSSLIMALQNARSVVVVTGAGVSQESGVPTFRDANQGIWAKYDPAKLATPEAFAKDPETVTRWYDWRRGKCAAARPNRAHLALARMEQCLLRRQQSFLLVTQNVDRLHQAAGSLNVVELHGTLWVWRCTRCSDEREERRGSFLSYPPKCACGGNRRPAVVWFGECLPEEAMMKSSEAAEKCDLFLSVGTSAVVYPAAGLLDIARRGGAKTAAVNKKPTPASEVVDWFILGRAGEILPVLVECAFGK